MGIDKPNNSSHIDEIHLLAYLESPQSEELKDICRHLTTCVSCRESLAKTQSMMGVLKHYSMPESEASSEGHPDEQVIADYVDGRTGSRQDEELKAHVDACGLCTKRVLHYALHSAELLREMEEGDTKEILCGVYPERSRRAQNDASLEIASHPPDVRNDTPPIQPFYRRIFSWRMPVWFGVPATAVVTAILVFILLGQERKEVGQPVEMAQQEKTKFILPYQENPQIAISPMKGKIPGIGFFSQSRGETRPFGGLTVQRLSGMQYRVSWHPIEGVVEYDIRVFTSGPPGERSLVAIAKGVRETSIIMDLSSLDPGKNYTWDLDGYMKDGRRFMTSGGFVVANLP